VKWIESEYERGSLNGTSRWTAILTVVVRPPSSAEALRKNPLGLYVDAIDWSRELETPAERAAPEPAPPAQPSPLDAAPPAGLPLGSPLDPNLGAEPANHIDPSERNSR